MITVTHPDDLDRAALERIAYGDEPVAVDEALLAQVDASREQLLRTLASAARVYGLNTGMGYLSSVDLDPQGQASHQRRLLLGRAVGSAPWLPREEARGVLAVRLAEFLRGHSGASAELCRFLVGRLNDGFCPAIPSTGVGTAGEIMPLAHAFQTFIGEGRVLLDNGTVEAAAALSERGVQPYEPKSKEGLALLAGAPAAVAIALGRLRSTRLLIDHLLVTSAASCDAIDAPRGPFDPVIGELCQDPLLSDTLLRLTALIGDGGPPAASHQAPVSFRVIPQVLTYLRRTADRFEEDTDRRLRAVTDSPVHVDGRFVSSGAFHAIELAAGMDHLTVALVSAAELCAQRVHRLLDDRVTGLAPQLAPQAGVNAGLVVVHKRAIGALNELRRLATPASIGLADTSLGQEDAQTFTFESAFRLRRVEELVAQVVSCELLCVRQAWWLRGRGPGPALEPLAATIASIVPPVEEDRPLGEDLDRLAGLLWDAPLPRAIGSP